MDESSICLSRTSSATDVRFKIKIIQIKGFPSSWYGKKLQVSWSVGNKITGQTSPFMVPNNDSLGINEQLEFLVEISTLSKSSLVLNLQDYRKETTNPEEYASISMSLMEYAKNNTTTLKDFQLLPLRKLTMQISISSLWRKEERVPIGGVQQQPSESPTHSPTSSPTTSPRGISSLPINQIPRPRLKDSMWSRFSGRSSSQVFQIGSPIFREENQQFNTSLKLIQENLIGYPGTLLIEGRQLLHQGELQGNHYLFLFSDCFILTLESGQSLKFQHIMSGDLSNTKIEGGKDLEFTIYSGEKSIRLFAKTEREKNKWISEFQAALQYLIRNQVFGVSLYNLLSHDGKNGTGIPVVLSRIFSEIRSRSDNLQGLFSSQQSMNEPQEIKKILDTDQDTDLSRVKTPTLGYILREFFALLPDKIIPDAFYDPLISLQKQYLDQYDYPFIMQLRNIFLHLSNPERTVLHEILRFLHDLVELHPQTTDNLAVIWTPILLKRKWDSSSAMEFPVCIKLVTCLILFENFIFSGNLLDENQFYEDLNRNREKKAKSKISTKNFYQTFSSSSFISTNTTTTTTNTTTTSVNTPTSSPQKSKTSASTEALKGSTQKSFQTLNVKELPVGKKSKKNDQTSHLRLSSKSESKTSISKGSMTTKNDHLARLSSKTTSTEDVYGSGNGKLRSSLNRRNSMTTTTPNTEIKKNTEFLSENQEIQSSCSSSSQEEEFPMSSSSASFLVSGLVRNSVLPPNKSPSETSINLDRLHLNLEQLPKNTFPLEDYDEDHQGTIEYKAANLDDYSGSSYDSLEFPNRIANYYEQRSLISSDEGTVPGGSSQGIYSPGEMKFYGKNHQTSATTSSSDTETDTDVELEREREREREIQMQRERELEIAREKEREKNRRERERERRKRNQEKERRRVKDRIRAQEERGCNLSPTITAESLEGNPMGSELLNSPEGNPLDKPELKSLEKPKKSKKQHSSATTTKEKKNKIKKEKNRQQSHPEPQSENLTSSEQNVPLKATNCQKTIDDIVKEANCELLLMIQTHLKNQTQNFLKESMSLVQQHVQQQLHGHESKISDLQTELSLCHQYISQLQTENSLLKSELSKSNKRSVKNNRRKSTKF